MIIDADMRSRTVLGRALRAAMMVTEAAVSGEDGIERIAQAEYDLVLLDIDLPGIDGFHVIQTVRQRGSRVPMVVVSSHSEDYEQLYALDLGADDYVTKPFNPIEVLARVKSQLRRYTTLGGRPKEDDALLFRNGGIVLDDGAKSVSVDGEPVNLTPIEYNILLLLMKNPGRVFSTGQIYELVWNDPSLGSENTVAVHIRHLREKIEIDPANPRYVKVVWGLGYKMEKQ